MRRKKHIVSKETFCNALRLIQRQKEKEHRFSLAINLMGDGHFVFGSPNHYLDAALIVLREALNDKHEYIDWWLYETCNLRTVQLKDGSKSWDLSTPEALYDYLTN